LRYSEPRHPIGGPLFQVRTWDAPYQLPARINASFQGQLAMKIAYLIPEFPGQTHSFFWRERIALKEIGVATQLVSTRPPPTAIISHDWADQAQSETFYLSKIHPADFLHSLIQMIGFGPAAWFRSIKAAADGCPLRKLPMNLALIFFAVRLAAFMRANEITHVHSHSCADSALVAMLAHQLSGVTYSLTLHGDLENYGVQQAVKWRNAAFAITITRRLHDQVIRVLAKNLPRQSGIAPMGVEADRFKRLDPYEPWNGEGPLRVFSCGRLNRIKGHQDLVQAAATLKASGINVLLEIAGEDETGGRGFHKELDTLIRDLRLADEVILLGAVSEMRVLEGLRAAHIFVLASHHEPLGVAIMEALSCETPVIATNIGGIPELIDHGVNGHLVPSQDSKALAVSIRDLAANSALAKKYSASGRKKIETSFNSRISALEMKRLLELTLARSDDQ
jgi:colanic acid/amylovoran biosynthesis glycosyltransferase